MSGAAERVRGWLGPLGRYRPGLFRKDMAAGFRNCDAGATPGWARWLGWSSPEERLLESLELNGKVVYDVGAHAGAYSLFFSRRVGVGGRVIAFEPQAASFAKLARNLQDNHIGNVVPLRLALGDEEGTRAIYMLPGMSTTASLAAEARTPLRRAVGETRIARLDDLIAELGLPAPEFIKIDVEGMEVEVLRGGYATLARHRPALLIEAHGASRRHKAERIREIAELLLRLGYELTHAESGQRMGREEDGVAAGHIFALAAVPA
ncbi:MAG TPA: FkbM family methyltransferase [Terriglobales bacterium]|nr:FkbM family methyltransferase [Terriglobales bacterium]